MSTDLERFRDHCHRMAQAGAHTDHCHVTKQGRYGDVRVHPDPACPGCVLDTDRRLFARLATEVDDHLHRHQDMPLEGTA